ncbi:cupin domain-containing protein [Streptomyces rameus]|uniref:Cupin domain-containing protein n=1 Tax=Streptomyces rameus TaxID=68261 RepID=A0ABP6NN76_9ACTN
MTIQPRLVVTERRTDGSSVVAGDGQPAPISVAAAPGIEFYLLWGTEDGGTTVGTGPRQPRTLPFFPGAGGTRLLLARYAPRSSVAEPVGDPESLAAEVAEKLPGLTDGDEPDRPGLHTTDTLDYGICLEGELYLELDDGREVLLTPGTCVVQQGTRHAWHNRGDEPALMCFVGIGATRES